MKRAVHWTFRPYFPCVCPFDRKKRVWIPELARLPKMRTPDGGCSWRAHRLGQQRFCGPDAPHPAAQVRPSDFSACRSQPLTKQCGDRPTDEEAVHTPHTRARRQSMSRNIPGSAARNTNTPIGKGSVAVAIDFGQTNHDCSPRPKANPSM